MSNEQPTEQLTGSIVKTVIDSRGLGKELCPRLGHFRLPMQSLTYS